MTQQVDRTFEHGRGGRAAPRARLAELLATGDVGGVDIFVGVFALLVVQEATGTRSSAPSPSPPASSPSRSGASELFTENSLIPISAMAAGRGSPWKLLRLWSFTLALNLAAGWILTLIVISGFPDLEETAVSVARHYSDLAIGWGSLAPAILGAAPPNHVVVVSGDVRRAARRRALRRRRMAAGGGLGDAWQHGRRGGLRHPAAPGAGGPGEDQEEQPSG